MTYIPGPSAEQFPSVTDSFDRERVSLSKLLFQSKLLFDKDSTRWDEQTTGSGVSTYNTNQASVTLSVGPGVGTVVRQTFNRFVYSAGEGQYFPMTGLLGVPTAGITRRIGSFDAKNGVFFESNPTDVATVIRSFTSGVFNDTVIPRSNWSYDKMDGSGPSGIDLDFSKCQIFAFDFQWLGVGEVRFGFFLDDTFYLANVMKHANLVTLAYMSNPNGPLRYEISGTGPVASLLQICSAVISEGGDAPLGQQRYLSRNVTPLVTLPDDDLYPLIAIKLQANREGAVVVPTAMSVLCTSNSNVEAQLLVNPTFAGTALVFANVPNSVVSGCATALQPSKVSGGIAIGGANVAAQASIAVEVPAEFQLGLSIAGVSDVLVLAVRRLNGNAENFYGSLTWRERY